MIIPPRDQFLLGLLFFCIGLLFRYVLKLSEGKTAEELDEYRREFERNPKRLVLWTFISAALGSSSPRFVQLVISPLVAWVVIAWGAAQMADAVVLLYWPRP